MKDRGVIKIYRFSRNLYKKHIPIIPKVLKTIIRIIYAATIPYTADIGEGTQFPHGGQGVVINENAVIGKNCIISAGVIIGGKKGTNRVPQIGNDCLIGANSCIIGDVRIGNNAVVGAGAVVVKDVEENSTYAGNPAKRIK